MSLVLGQQDKLLLRWLAASRQSKTSQLSDCSLESTQSNKQQVKNACMNTRLQWVPWPATLMYYGADYSDRRALAQTENCCWAGTWFV